MECSEFRQAVESSVFGEPSPDELARANGHLATCERCRADEARLLALRDSLRGGVVAPGGELRAHVLAAFPSRQPAAARGPWRRPVPAYVAVIACALGAFTTFVVLRAAPLGQTLARGTVVPDRAALPAPEVAFNPAGSYDTNVSGHGVTEGSGSSSAPGRRSGVDSL